MLTQTIIPCQTAVHVSVTESIFILIWGTLSNILHTYYRVTLSMQLWDNFKVIDSSTGKF